MSNPSSLTIANLIRRSVFQTILVAFIAVCFLFAIYGFVQHYKQQRLQVQQLSKLLVNSASTVDGASLVARQINLLLDNDPTLSNITFYSTDSPILAVDNSDIARNNRDWYNALFADSISFNRAVTSRYLGSSNYYNSPQSEVSDRQVSEAESSEALATPEVLIGYINITLDIKKLRSEWLYQHYLLLLSIILAVVASVFYLLRRLRLVADDLTELAKVSQILVSNSEAEQLPAIQQGFKFKELRDIRLALVSLFERLQERQQELEELAVFEQQLYNKDLSLNVQRNNFQSMITHELKTSLNAISGGLQLLDNQYASEQQKDTLAIIHKGSQHLEATIEQIIQLNKIEKGQVSVNISEFNPLQLLSDLFAEFEEVAKQKGLELISRIHHVDYKLEGDGHKIKQILMTLIDNAIKFTDSGEVIIESQLNHFNKSIRWEIKVSDTGIGIDNRYLKDIFEPFFQIDPSYTRDYEGAGVGLPVINQVIQLLGASIEVNSELKVGSQFKVVFPLQDAYQSNFQHAEKSLTNMNIIYYYHEKMGAEVEQLKRLGATVIGKQHELSVLQELKDSKIEVVMIAQQVLPKKAAQIARLIRAEEARNRVLIIYWYPTHQKLFLTNFEYSLKAAGVDYCYAATEGSNALHHLLKKQ